MKEKIIQLAKSTGADLIGFANASRFDENDEIFKIFPQVKTVIGLGFRVLRGSYRGIEEGTTYYQYSTMGVENLEETVMPMCQIRVSMMLEEEGAIAIPQRRHQQIMKEVNSTNPEKDYAEIYRGITAEHQMNFTDAAIKCGLGEMGFSGALLTDEFGPFIRYCFILTDAILDETPIKTPHLCDKCGKCKKACPGNAITNDGGIDPWQCAVYYNGANGIKNPFMEPGQYENFENRLEIISGKARVSPELARKIIDSTYCYPPIGHKYKSSICGRACDIACYIHLEEKGLLTKKFRSSFRKREEWIFDIEDYK